MKENEQNRSKLVIRPINEKDAEQIKTLDNIAISKYSLVLSGEVYKKLSRNTEGICKEPFEIFGAFLDDTLVGYCTVDGYGNNSALGSVLSNVFVLPEYQHKKIGTEMVRVALKSAVRPVYICCLGQQYPFYEFFGFQKMSNHPMDLMILQ